MFLSPKCCLSIIWITLLSIFNIKVALSQRSLVDSLSAGYLQEGNDTLRLKILSELAWTLHYSDSADVYYYEAIELSRRLGQPGFEAQNLNRIGLYFKNRDFLEEALMYYEKALALARDENVAVEEGYALNNIAQVYFSKRLYQESIEFSEHAVDIFSGIGFDKGLAYAYLSLGMVYLKLGQPEHSLELVNKCIAIRETINEERPKWVARLVRGDIYAEFGRKEEALMDYNEFLTYTKDKDLRGSVLVYSKIGELYHKYGEDEKATENAMQAIKLHQSAPSFENVIPAYEVLYEVRKKQGDYISALEYMENYAEAHKMLNERKINMYLTNFQIQKQREEIEHLNNERLMKEKQEQAGKQFNLVLILLLLIFSCGLFIYYRANQSRKESYLKLKAQSDKIEKQSLELEKLNQVKDKIFSILSHDLRSPLLSLQSIIHLMEEQGLSKEEFEKLVPELSKNVANNMLLLENLLMWSKSQIIGSELKPQKIDLQSIIDSNLQFIVQSTYFKGQQIIRDIQGPVNVLANKGMLDIVIRNLLSNALKFTDKGDKVYLKAFSEDDNCIFCVEDEGVGIREDNLGKLFGAEFFTTIGTKNEVGTGLGLLLCKELLKKNNGEIWAESEVGTGSRFYFRLPKA